MVIREIPSSITGGCSLCRSHSHWKSSLQKFGMFWTNSSETGVFVVSAITNNHELRPSDIRPLYDEVPGGPLNNILRVLDRRGRPPV